MERNISPFPEEELGSFPVGSPSIMGVCVSPASGHLQWPANDAGEDQEWHAFWL